MAIADEVRQTGAEIAAATGDDIADALNSGIEKFVRWPYRAVRGAVVDGEGTHTGVFRTVVCARKQEVDSADGEMIASDAAAAVIEVMERLEEIDSLRAAYASISSAKRLKKSPVERVKGTPISTETLGIIYAQRSTLTAEDLVEELQRLNAQTESREWPDMVAVGNTLAINYVAQFPGDGLGGDFLPPGEGALDSYTPPFYIVMVIRPTVGDTFNRLLAFLIGHLAFFSPGPKLPNFTHILEGVTQTALTICGYQYDLQGKLLPVPREFYSDR